MSCDAGPIHTLISKPLYSDSETLKQMAKQPNSQTERKRDAKVYNTKQVYLTLEP